MLEYATGKGIKSSRTLVVSLFFYNMPKNRWKFVNVVQVMDRKII